MVSKTATGGFRPYPSQLVEKEQRNFLEMPLSINQFNFLMYE